MARSSSEPPPERPARKHKKSSSVSGAHQPHIQELRLLELIEHLPVGVLWTDIEGRIIYVNQWQAAITGYQVGDIISPVSEEPHPFWRWAGDHTPVRWKDLPISRSIASGESVEAVLEKDDKQSDAKSAMLVKTQLLRDDHGNLTDIVAVLVDITAQHQAEEAARARAMELDTVFESITDGVIIYNQYGAPVRYNQAALRMMGWLDAGIDPRTLSAELLAARYDLRLVTGETLTPEHWPMRRALVGESTATVEASVRRADGHRMIASIRAAPLRDPDSGAIMGAVAILQDVTTHFNLEKMKEDFIGIASHELRTPLAALVLASRLLQKRLKMPERATDLAKLGEDIVMQVKRMSQVINNIVDLTRVSGAHFAIQARAGDLAASMREAIAEQRGISKRAITVQGIDQPIPALADDKRIAHALANLLANAVKYSPESSPVEVNVTQIAASADSSALRVVVRDYGAGIAPEHLRTIFDRTAAIPVDPVLPLEQQVRGLGLGLYIARAIVEAHGGHIAAESQVGMGSAFRFEIPLIPPDEV